MRIRWVPLQCLVAAVGCAHAASSAPGASEPVQSEDQGSSATFANPSAKAEENAARDLVEKLGAHDATAATVDFDPSLKGTLPPDKLAQVWSQLEGQFGTLITIEDVHGQPYARGWGVLVTCRFEHEVHTLSVFFEPGGKIKGFWPSPGIAAANLFVDALGYHHPELADALSDAQLHDSTPTDKLAQAWSDIESSYGDYRGIREVTDKGTHALVVVAFGHGKPTMDVAVDPRGKVTGFHVVGN